MSFHLHSMDTPNGLKVRIMLAELKVEYEFHLIDIGKGDQFSEDFLAISPNNKIPALIDTEGPDGNPISLFESGAILIYLAEKFDYAFFSEHPRQRYEILIWLMFQMGGIGPFLGQAHHFRRFAPEKIPYAIKRYTDEATRLYGVMNKRLAKTPWLAAEKYTIADMACFPWIASYKWQGQDLADYPHLEKWFRRIEQREAVQSVFGEKATRD